MKKALSTIHQYNQSAVVIAGAIGGVILGFLIDNLILGIAIGLLFGALSYYGTRRSNNNQ